MGWFDSLTNSGQMDIGSGDAKSGVGEFKFDANATFGGLNYNNNSVSPLLIGFAAVVIGSLYYLNRKG